MRRKKSDFNHDAALRGFLKKTLQALEIGSVPLSKIKLVSSTGVARSRAAGPGGEKVPGFRRHGIALDAERFARQFAIQARKKACQVQAGGLQRGEIVPVVQSGVHHRAIVLAASNERDGLAAENEVVRISRIEADRIRF